MARQSPLLAGEILLADLHRPAKHMMVPETDSLCKCRQVRDTVDWSWSEKGRTWLQSAGTPVTAAKGAEALQSKLE